MNENRIQRRKSLSLILGVVLLLLLLAVLLIPNGFARYRTQVAQANKLSFDSRLAESFTLSHSGQESDGKCYYLLLPGTKSTFDPTITITGKTEIPAFLYLEITGPSTTLNADWTLLNVTGMKGGRVYVYNAVLTIENGGGKITPQISVNWDKVPAKNSNKTLQVYAYMIQQESKETKAEDAFSAAVSKDTAR